MTNKTDTRTSRTYYVTKYALSGGIKAVTGGPREDDANYIATNEFWSLRLGKDIFETPVEAQANAIRRRIKKIAALKKQIEKLEKMTFKVET